MYTCVVEIEAWPSSSCTTRMSAPWSSMWVAHEWRSTCGLTVVPDSPTRVAVGAHDAPRALARQPAAAGVEEHRLGVAAAGPALGLERAAAAGAEPVRQRVAAQGGRAARSAPWRPCRRPAPGRRRRSRSPSDSPTSSEMRMPVPYSTSRMARSRRCERSAPTTGVEQRRRPRPRSAAWAAPAGPAATRRRRPGRRRPALVGEEAVQRAAPRPAPGPPSPGPCRRPAARRRSARCRPRPRRSSAIFVGREVRPCSTFRSRR